MAELENVRKVLDYAPPERTPRGVYYDALNRRLNREVAVKRVGVAAARPARDEALLVVPPDEWEAAVAARQKDLAREEELQHIRDAFNALQSRHTEILNELERVRDKMGDAKDRTALQLVGVRRSGQPEPVAEPVVVEPEPVPEPAVEPAPEPPAEEVFEEVTTVEQEAEPKEEIPEAEPYLPTQDELRQAGWITPANGGPTPQSRVETYEPSEEAPEAAVFERADGEGAGGFAGAVRAARRRPGARLARMEEQLERSEHELERVEAELQQLEERERELQSMAPAGPYKFRGYTLYQRDVKRGKKTVPFYFFSKKPPASGRPVAKPPGHIVATNARSGLPYLKSAAAKPRRRKSR